MTENQPPDDFDPSATTSKDRQLVDTQSARREQAAELASMTGGVGAAAHNYEGKGVDLWKFTQKVTGGSVKSSDDFPADGIALVNIYCHKVEVTDPRNGEVSGAFRTVLVDENGDAYGFVSDGILQSVIGIFKAYNFGPISPPLKVKLDVIKTRSGRKMLTLAPV